MKKCPLCGFELDESELTKHYLRDVSLISFIQQKNIGWTVAEGACSRCLEIFYREHHSTGRTIAGEEVSEERTVITAPNELIQEQKDLSRGACVVVIHGVDLGKKYDLEKETLIGRGETAQIRVNEENVSRLHAIIFKKDGEIHLEDQDSTNGTFVNTRKVKSKVLKDGDLILIGNTIMKFMSGSTVENQYHEEIYRLATVDGLTKVYNKNFFLEKLEDEFSRSKRYDRSLSMIMFDFDRFKTLNDTHGHLAGDEILKKSAALVLKNLRKEDICGRYGGEEFGIILPETSKDNALQLAEKLRKLIETTAFDYEEKKLSITISIGISTLSKSIETAKQMIEQADKFLYQAKNDGRNCVRS